MLTTSRSARSRILGWYALLIGCALVAALVAQRAFLLNRVDREVDVELARTVVEFQQVAAGEDPDTGESFGGDVGAVVNAYLSARVGVRGSAVVVFLDGEAWASDLPGGPLVASGVLDPWAEVTVSTSGSVDTADGPVRILATPVTATGGGGAVLVATINVQPRLDDVAHAMRVAALASMAVFLLVSVVAWWTAGNVLRPLRDLRRTAETISEEDLTARIEVTSHDEIGDLATTFNTMLDRIEEAFSLQRRFVDDAGHELRTPITIIKGQLEMLDDDPAERAAAMALVHGELDRMSRIVEDLLVLARQDQPDFVVPRPVDLADLMEDLARRARALLGRDVPVSACPPAVVMLDQQRVVQAMLNLVRNSEQHTAPGTRISLGAELNDGVVYLWVHDDGPGIPSDEVDKVLRRFGRGSDGPRTGGAGLGLAIVEAIATSHGGHVAIESSPGATRIGMVLPQYPAADEPAGGGHGAAADQDRLPDLEVAQ